MVNHTVDVDGSDHAGIRWYEVRNPGSTPGIYQQGTYAPDADNRWMGSTAMDGAGNMAIGFSVSGPTTFPSIRYTGRLAADPPGTMAQGENDLMVGSGSQQHDSGRWGDYSLLGVDPVDDCTFWYTQEYYAATSVADWHTRVGSFALPPCSPGSSPELPLVTVSASMPNAAEAGPVNGAFTVSRTGATDDPLVVTYHVAGTATPGDDYVPLPGTVTIDAGQSSVTLLVVPVDDLAAEPDETVSLSLVADPAYLIGSSGTTVTIVSDDLPPDLVVSALTAPSTGGASETITLAETTTNQGGGTAEPSVTAFVLSHDFRLDAADVALGSRDVPQLAAGASSSASTTLTIPSGTATGIYYMLAVADAPGTVAESLETNNVRYWVVRIGPDLVVSWLTAPPSAGAGGMISVSETTTNQGGGAASASTTTFYLSTNFSLDEGDMPLGSLDVPALASGGGSTASIMLTIPGDTPTGSYRVIAMADGHLVVPETIENNNTRYSGVMNVGPDLVVTGVTGPSSAGAGFMITVTDVVANQGAAMSPTSTTAVYLSTNIGVDSSDILLGTHTVPPLAAGASSSTTSMFLVPPTAVTGTYYVLARADANDEVVESSETNNVRAGLALRLGPDLIVSGLSLAPNKVPAGQAIVVTDTVKNNGGGGAGGSTTGFYLSTNLVLEPTDIPIGERSVPALGPGAANTGTTTIVIPAGTTPGIYYVIATADRDATVVETSDGDNTRLAYLQVLAP